MRSFCSTSLASLRRSRHFSVKVASCNAFAVHVNVCTAGDDAL
jgi:hypothetical protein